AHLDNMPSGAVAPGADDNASGIAGVLTAASILGQYEWNCTLRFVAFTGEEQGLRGSSAYATKVYSDTENIAGVLNLDMVGFNALDEPVIELHTKRSIDNNQSDLAIAYLFSNVVASYNLDLTSEIIQDRESRSDHASFWSRGYPGILAIEDFSDFTPYYHSVNDTVYTLDAAYFTEFVKAAVGTFAHMGCLVVPEIAVAPSAISVSILPETSITQTLSITNYSGELTWQLAETPPVSWLSEAITAGQLAIEGIDIPLFFDTAGLPEGVYTTTLTIDSNDPDEPQTSVGVTLTTTLQPPPPPILQYLPWLTKYRSE
ncbi:MAG: Zn-dependent exopeptidase M28, partial [Chloroflexota bacterium]